MENEKALEIKEDMSTDYIADEAAAAAKRHNRPPEVILAAAADNQDGGKCLNCVWYGFDPAENGNGDGKGKCVNHMRRRLR